MCFPGFDIAEFSANSYVDVTVHICRQCATLLSGVDLVECSSLHTDLVMQLSVWIDCECH